MESPETTDDEELRVFFNLPEGPARETLAQAAGKAKVEIMFSVKDVDGVVTNAVDGFHTLEEAFEIMLANTELELVETGSSGVYAVKRLKSSVSSRVDRRFHQAST